VVTPEAIDKARNKIVANSFLTVAIGRSIPGLMVPTSIVAGTLKMPIRKFLTGIIFPLSLWIILLTTLGGSFGHYMPQLRFNAGSFLILLGALVMLAILASAIYRKKAPSVLESDRTQTISIGQATKDE
jgi:membrane protein DedA with SNARE-associated domain